MLKHLAVYSLNIVILRTIVCTSEHSFRFENEGIWNKLVCLWKFAFSNDELSNYANIFMAIPKEDTCLIKYNYVNKSMNSQQNGVDKLFKSYLAIGDELTYSIIGALIGSGKKEKIIDGMNRNQLNIKARYIWNYILNILDKENFSQYEIISILKEYNIYCQKDDDVEYIFAYYLLVYFLLKKKIIRYNNKEVKSFLLKDIILGHEDLRYIERRYMERRNLAYFALEISLDILDYITLEDDEIERIFIEFSNRISHDRFMYQYSLDFMYGYSLEFMVRFYNIIIRKLVYYGNSRCVENLIRKGYFYESIEKILWNHAKISNVQILGEIIELLYNFMLLEETKVCGHLIEMFLDILGHQGFNREVRISMKQKIMFIKCLYKIYPNKPKILTIHKDSIKNILQNITLKKVFQTSEETAIKLCNLERRENIIDQDRMRKDLMWIINNQISEEFCKEIYTIAKTFRWNELKLALEKKHAYK